MHAHSLLLTPLAQRSRSSARVELDKVKIERARVRGWTIGVSWPCRREFGRLWRRLRVERFPLPSGKVAVFPQIARAAERRRLAGRPRRVAPATPPYCWLRLFLARQLGLSRLRLSKLWLELSGLGTYLPTTLAPFWLHGGDLSSYCRQCTVITSSSTRILVAITATTLSIF